jgi:hypothetical protein
MPSKKMASARPPQHTITHAQMAHRAPRHIHGNTLPILASLSIPTV